MQTTDTLEARVARGAALLDDDDPVWFDNVDLDRLDVGDCYDCVLGQIYGYYSAGFNYLDLLSTGNAAANGFTLSWNYPSSGDEFADLTDAWRALIEQRRAAEGGAPDE